MNNDNEFNTASFSDEEELRNRLALHFLPRIGPVLARLLISYCGSVEEVFRKRKNQLERIPGIGRERAALIRKDDVFERAETEIAFLKKHQVRPLFYLDADYPWRLKHCDDAPLMIFTKGTSCFNEERLLAVVGTRHMTAYGRECTQRLLEELAVYKPVIVSGLAYGIDIQAHKSAMKNSLPTVGVVAHGLDRIYPSENRPTAEKMIRSGAILSEYPSRTKPDREKFPARNRIVAGMCDAVIVVESADKGGALITAALANDYNREVFAIPGRVTDPFSQGCHQLIRENKAMLMENAANIAAMMGWDQDATNKKKKPAQLELFHSLNEDELRIVDLLREEGKSGIDRIARGSDLSLSRVSSALLSLEFAGALRVHPGKTYELIV